MKSVLGRNKVSIRVTEKGVRIILTESYDLFHQDDVEHSLRHEIQVIIHCSFYAQHLYIHPDWFHFHLLDYLSDAPKYSR